MSQKKNQHLSTFAPSERKASKEETAVFEIPASSRVLVIGAGVFGGWTALNLLRMGYKVTLADSWGPGNSLSSSGGETRLIRAIYGDNRKYFDMTVNAWSGWMELEEKSGQKVIEKTGVSWFFHDDGSGLRETITEILKERNWPYEVVDPDRMPHRFPTVNSEGLESILVEKNAGFLYARESCRAVESLFRKEGGKFEYADVQPGEIQNEELTCVQMNSRKVNYDYYVFASGPWLPQLFPIVFESLITVSRQEVYYFGVPAAKTAEFSGMIPWIDWDPDSFYYGLMSKDERGFKLACDIRGENCDPTSMERSPTKDLVERSRQYLSFRFPDLADAPLIESRVCQYSNTWDGNFILDQHPEARNIWLLGGGSGHGYKHGPSIGKMAAEIIGGHRPPDPDFQIPG